MQKHSGKSKNLRNLYAFIKITPNDRDLYAVIDGVEYNLRFCPELKDRWSKFEAMYYYESKVVLNGVEVNFWDDGYYPEHLEVLNCIGTRPGYIILSDDQHINGVPSNEIMHVRGGHPHELLIDTNLIPRKYCDKVILYRHYLDSSLYFSSIKKSIYSAKTGGMDKIELDLNNPNPDVLQTMIQLGVCRKIDPTYKVNPHHQTIQYFGDNKNV